MFSGDIFGSIRHAPVATNITAINFYNQSDPNGIPLGRILTNEVFDQVLNRISQTMGIPVKELNLELTYDNGVTASPLTQELWSSGRLKPPFKILVSRRLLPLSPPAPEIKRGPLKSRTTSTTRSTLRPAVSSRTGRKQRRLTRLSTLPSLSQLSRNPKYRYDEDDLDIEIKPQEPLSGEAVLRSASSKLAQFIVKEGKERERRSVIIPVSGEVKYYDVIDPRTLLRMFNENTATAIATNQGFIKPGKVLDNEQLLMYPFLQDVNSSIIRDLKLKLKLDGMSLDYTGLPQQVFDAIVVDPVRYNNLILNATNYLREFNRLTADIQDTKQVELITDAVKGTLLNYILLVSLSLDSVLPRLAQNLCPAYQDFYQVVTDPNGTIFKVMNQGVPLVKLKMLIPAQEKPSFKRYCLMQPSEQPSIPAVPQQPEETKEIEEKEEEEEEFGPPEEILAPLPELVVQQPQQPQIQQPSLSQILHESQQQSLAQQQATQQTLRTIMPPPPPRAPRSTSRNLRLTEVNE